MWYLKAPGSVIRLSPSGKFYERHEDTDWGRITQYREVSDDQFAVRQVDVYENGNVLRYDRSHRRDDYGSLMGRKFSRKAKWAIDFPGAEMISADDFDKVWQQALKSPLWETQVASRLEPKYEADWRT
jgi:hypothetical protein